MYNIVQNWSYSIKKSAPCIYSFKCTIVWNVSITHFKPLFAAKQSYSQVPLNRRLLIRGLG